MEKKSKSLDALEIAHRVIDQELDAIRILKSSLDENFQQAVDLILSRTGRVIITGLGKSGAIGRKLAATMASTGTASYFLHASEGIHGDLGIVHKDDVIICLSKSGNTDELNYLLPVFRKLNVPIISITSNVESVLAQHSQVVLNIGVKEEACPHDLSPTSSTTAMMVLGDALAIALLERRNFTREDFAFLHPAGSLGKRLLVRVDDIMEKGTNIPFVRRDAYMKEAVLEMASKRGICMVVDAEKQILGVMTTGDLNRLVERTEHFFDIPVTEVMNKNPKIINAGTLAYTAYKKMEEYRIIAMPVVDDQKKLCGVIHLHDIMRAGIF
ncbi:MAG: KpsF/GutQ family sugar-phosphate isomerase [Calditrichaeota bacterium]|nr:KpsF/GutQ family sugar-phosphate isomerase [Calditrichota bacterium]RQV98578.1 MAG: KpsF/GutQ family sugar-phosphate isomerase [Calditrichota bacterium]